jgi:hypothetical protein
MIPFTMTQDAITVVFDGKVYTVQAGTPQYHGLRDCIFREDWAAISKHVSMTGALQQWLGDKFVVQGEQISYEGSLLPTAISQRIWTMAGAGESPGPLFAFYERLAKNPSYRSVQQLWDFLAHAGIPLEPDGTFLAYKGVRADFLDAHSATFSNEPGAVLRMPRNQISDDAEQACHIGFHVGALIYAKGFSERVVICRVDPEHVVCVPRDSSMQKMRVCEYTVVGNWINPDEQLPSTVYTASAPTDAEEDEWGGDVEYEDEPEVDGHDEHSIQAAPNTEVSERGVVFGPDGLDEVFAFSLHAEAARRYFAGRGVTGPLPLPPTPRVVVSTNKPTAPRAATFNRKNPRQLMEESIEDLRKYASAHLKIVGAYKLAGGKTKLVSAILKARRKRSR